MPTDREILQSIVDAYDCRSELFTNDEDCAGNLADRARKQLAAAASAAEQKPVRYELRMCAEGQCDDWKPVSKDRYETLTANGGDAGDGLKFEGRALYAAPIVAAAPGDDDKDKRIAELEQVLQRIALNISGDTPAQVLAGEVLPLLFR